MNRRKQYWLTPLILAAAMSVIAFAGIGVAAITGHISMNTMDANLLAGLLGKSKGSPARAESATTSARAKSTKALAKAGNKPIDFKRGSRVGGRKSKCNDCGVVDSIRAKEVESAGVVASSFWNGADNGRAYAAQSPGITYAALTRSSDARVAVNFVVTVRMEDGTVRTIHENQRPPLSIGERVRLVNGAVVPQG